MRNNCNKCKKTNLKRKNNKKDGSVVHIDYDQMASAIIRATENNIQKKEIENQKIIEQKIEERKAILKCKFPIIKLWFLRKKDAKQLSGTGVLLQTFNVFVLRIIWVILYCLGFSILLFGIHDIFNLSFVFSEIVPWVVTMLIGIFIVTFGSLVRIAMIELENNNDMQLQLSMFTVLTGIITIVLSVISIIVTLK